MCGLRIITLGWLACAVAGGCVPEPGTTAGPSNPPAVSSGAPAATPQTAAGPALPAARDSLPSTSPEPTIPVTPATVPDPKVEQPPVAEKPPAAVPDATPPAVAEPPAAPRYEVRQDHDPDGIGKFYMDREIAHVMGWQAANWLERTEREEEERLTLLVKELKLKPGMVAADIGAGSGVITLMMAKKVGSKGRVLAVDVQQEMLDLLAKKLKQKKIDNVELILGVENSPKLKTGVLDLALMVDVYHEFEWPYEMLTDIAAALKPGGRVAFVEYRKEDPDVPIKLVHKMTVDQVKKEASLPELRLKFKETIETLPRQHIIVFERLPDEVKAGEQKADESKPEEQKKLPKP